MIATIAEKEKRLLDENNGHTITDEEFLARQASNNAIPTLSKQIAEISETFRPNMTDAKYMEMISLEYDKIRQYQNILNTLFDQNGLDVYHCKHSNREKKASSRGLKAQSYRFSTMTNIILNIFIMEISLRLSCKT